MTQALTAATWFIWENNARQREFEDDELGGYEGITHLKLQKMLYFAQGIHLALTGNRLFPEKIWAWKHGPVVNEVYQEFKQFGKNVISVAPDAANCSAVNSLIAEDENSLELTYDYYAIYTAWQLRNMTHEKGTPWDITVSQKGYNSEIDLGLMRDYFIENVVENV